MLANEIKPWLPSANSERGRDRHAGPASKDT